MGAIVLLYPRGIPGQGRGMGRAIRTDRYRLVEWTVPAKEFSGCELYDLETDPGENVNFATQPEHATLADERVAALLAGKTIRKAIVVPGRLVNFVAG